jgi:hypothetical protein
MLFQHKRMHYPFELSQHTRYNDHGYLFFCRPEPEDANIVAHNVGLSLLKHVKHISVEMTRTSLIIKYLHKTLGRSSALTRDLPYIQSDPNTRRYPFSSTFTAPQG